MNKIKYICVQLPFPDTRMTIHKDQMWDRTQAEIKRQAPAERFLSMLHTHFKNADNETRKAINKTGDHFAKSQKKASTPPLMYLQQITLLVFLDESQIISRCNAAIISGLVDEDAAYQTFLDTMTIQQLFIQLNSWHPVNTKCPH